MLKSLLLKQLSLPSLITLGIMSLCIEKRGLITKLIDYRRVELTFDMPLAEIVFDFMTV
jgi:translation elongation factor EF-4